jgi:site-specific DNA-methyltransferase (adenine-specific)
MLKPRPAPGAGARIPGLEATDFGAIVADAPGQGGFARNVAQRGDALDLLRSLPVDCSRVGFFDPPHRDNLDYLKYGNEGARQRGRCKLPQMSSEYNEQCLREMVRVLRPSGYAMLWQNTYLVGEGWHKKVADVLKCVDLIAWDNQRKGMGSRACRRGDYVVVLQKPPAEGRKTWRTKPVIYDRWVEKIRFPTSQHPHIKPIGLISSLILAITDPGDLIIDPCAGSFVVMHAAVQIGREFIGCDLAYAEHAMPEIAARHRGSTGTSDAGTSACRSASAKSMMQRAHVTHRRTRTPA